MEAAWQGAPTLIVYRDKRPARFFLAPTLAAALRRIVSQSWAALRSGVSSSMTGYAFLPPPPPHPEQLSLGPEVRNYLLQH